MWTVSFDFRFQTGQMDQLAVIAGLLIVAICVNIGRASRK